MSAAVAEVHGEPMDAVEEAKETVEVSSPVKEKNEDEAMDVIDADGAKANDISKEETEDKVKEEKAKKGSPKKSPSKAKSGDKAKEADAEMKEEKEVEKKSTSPKKSPSKSPKKSPTKTESPKKKGGKEKVKSEDEESDDEEDEEEGEKKIAVLDAPLVVSGKRQRSGVDRLQLTLSASSDHKVVSEGTGTPLGDIPFANQCITKSTPAQLRLLHRIAFKTMGKERTIRADLRKFNGFPFDAKAPEFERRLQLLKNAKRSEMAELRRMFGLPMQKTKEEEAQQIMEFLLAPSDSGKKVPQKKSRKRSAVDKSSSKKSAKKVKVEKSDGEEEEESDNESEEDESEEETKKKAPAKKKSNGATPKKATSTKKSPKKSPKKAKKSAETVDDSSDGEKDDDEDKASTPLSSSSDERTEVKKEEEVKKPALPDESTMIGKVKELIATFDLTQVTMRQMVERVCKEFPEFPALADNKNFVKKHIREQITAMENNANE